MATKARQQYFADEDSLQKKSREFSIADEIQQKIDSVEEGAQVNVIETVKVNGTALTPDANKAINVEVPEVIDNLYTVDPDNALSAKQGKLLYDYIQNIASRGRFLSNWNSATGLPTTNPSESPYPYKSGDYFNVSNVASGGGTNYRPDGSSYIIGQASTVVETEDVSVSDFYFYDGTNWLLLSNSGRQIAIDTSLSTTSTNPVENRVVTNAINGKQNTLTAGNHISISSDVISATGFQEPLTAGENITIGDECTTESDMKGPCPKGFHIPTNTEWTGVYNIWVTLGGGASDGTSFRQYFKMPGTGMRMKDSSLSLGSSFFWASNVSGSTYAYCFRAGNGMLRVDTYSISYGLAIRPFKNTPVTPDNTWTTLYDGSSVAAGAGIFHNISEGLISISGDGSTWVTMADKDLGATTVWNNGDALSDANRGYYYQRGNCYGFAKTGNITKISTTSVDGTGYGPGNYYESDTWINNSWTFEYGTFANLRGGVTQGTFQDCIHNVISAVDTTYTAGTGISIDSNNVISATATPGQTYTAGNGINIDANNEISNTLPGPTIAATAPTGTEGALRYDTTNDVLMAHNGTVWKEAGTQMKVLSYGHSTWQDFIDAYNENAIVYCRASSQSNPGTGNQTRMAFMAFVDINATTGVIQGVEFQYYRSRNAHSTAATVLDEVYIYKLTPSGGGTWTVTQRDTAAEPIAGTGIGLTYNASGMTIANTGVTSVNGSAGAVTVSEFSAANGGMKVFDMPDVGDDVSDIVARLSGGGTVMLHHNSFSENNYYYVRWSHTSLGCFSCTRTNAAADINVVGYNIFYDVSTNIVTIKNMGGGGLVPTGGNNGDVLTIVNGARAWQAPSGGDVLVSSQANNIFTSGMKIWGGTQSDYQSLTPDSNTAYLLLANQPTPPSPGRQPGANTLAYRPLTDDYDDYSGNNYNLTNNSTNLTTVDGVKCCDMNNSKCTANMAVTSLPYTMVFWNKSKVSGGNFSLMWQYSGDWGGSGFGGSGNNFEVRYGNNTNKNTIVSITVDTNWHMYALTFDTTGCYVYFDGVQTDNPKQSLVNSVANTTPFYIGGSYSGSVIGNNYMGAVIIEDKARTAQEIQDYYDQTKGNYGIS